MSKDWDNKWHLSHFMSPEQYDKWSKDKVFKKMTTRLQEALDREQKLHQELGRVQQALYKSENAPCTLQEYNNLLKENEYLHHLLSMRK